MENILEQWMVEGDNQEIIAKLKNLNLGRYPDLGKIIPALCGKLVYDFVYQDDCGGEGVMSAFSFKAFDGDETYAIKAYYLFK